MHSIPTIQVFLLHALCGGVLGIALAAKSFAINVMCVVVQAGVATAMTNVAMPLNDTELQMAGRVSFGVAMPLELQTRMLTSL